MTLLECFSSKIQSFTTDIVDEVENYEVLVLGLPSVTAFKCSSASQYSYR
jgi:hypothetical protein